MTLVKVVDASAIAALVFVEEQSQAIADRLESSELHAPALLRHEIASVGMKKLRRNLMTEQAILEGLVRFMALDIEFADVQPVPTFELAARTGLSAYDASYLWLARTLDAELVTLDAKLAANV